MTFTIDPNLIENNEVRLTEDANGELAIEHISSGNTITVDQDVSISDIVTDTLPSNVDAQGNDINNVGSLNTGDGSIDKLNHPATTVTISSGEITYESTYMIVGGEGGTSDTLNTINGASEGSILIIRSDVSTLTVAHSAGNIYLESDADATLSANEHIELISDGFSWFEIGTSGT